MEQVKLQSEEYVVLDEVKDSNNNYYILAVKGMRGVSVEYVTWLKNDRGLTLGHYFHSLEHAQNDLKKRADK